MATRAEEIQQQVRANSRAVWNEWVGGSRTREFLAYGVAGLFAVHGIIADVGWYQSSHQPVLPASVITVDKFGQVLDRRKPFELPTYTDLQLKHHLAAFIDEVFTIYNSADVLHDNYQAARAYMLPGSQAFIDVQKYWDRYSPLRRIPGDGTLRIVNPPENKITVGVPSFLARGKTTDGAEVWDVSWTATATRLDDGSQVAAQRYTGRIEFVRSLDGLDDSAQISNPFGIRVRFFKWDKQQ